MVIVFSEGLLRRILSCCFPYYHGSRIELGLDKGTPDPRPIQEPEQGASAGSPSCQWTTPSLGPARRLRDPFSVTRHDLAPA